MGSDQVIAAALGRPFRLGMLYDARTDQLCQGSALWDSAALQTITHRKPQPHSDFRISASDSLEEKASLLEVQASLKASVLCGLVDGEGSAKYLHDHQEFKNQSRVTLQYKATTHFEQLRLTADDWEKVQNKDMMDKGLATHVVTGIEYGANAFFVFDSQILQASDVQEFKLRVKVVIHIFFWSVHFDYDRDLTEEQKSLVKKLKVKFYSDFLFDSSPATLAEAVQTYTKMTKLLGENEKNAVPVRVWMMPLIHQNATASRLVQQISVGLVLEAERALEDLTSIKMRCNDCLSVSAVGKFPPLQHQVHTFYQLCHYYTAELQRQMAEKCPAIREGTEQESVLRNLFDQRDKSPFSHGRLTQWLKDKEREVNVVQSCLDIMKGIQVLSTQAEVDRFVLAPENAVSSGYIFTFLKEADPFLEEMGRYVSALKKGKSYGKPVQVSGQSWYYCDEAVAKTRRMAEAFSKTTGPVFIASQQRDTHSGSVVFQYKDGQVVGGKNVCL